MCVHERSKVSGFTQRKRYTRVTSTWVKTQRDTKGRGDVSWDVPASILTEHRSLLWKARPRGQASSGEGPCTPCLRTVSGSPFIGFKQMYLNVMVTGQYRAFNMHSSRLLHEWAPRSKQHKSQNPTRV